jgi:hypothetical protein
VISLQPLKKVWKSGIRGSFVFDLVQYPALVNVKVEQVGGWMEVVEREVVGMGIRKKGVVSKISVFVIPLLYPVWKELGEFHDDPCRDLDRER